MREFWDFTVDYFKAVGWLMLLLFGMGLVGTSLAALCWWVGG